MMSKCELAVAAFSAGTGALKELGTFGGHRFNQVFVSFFEHGERGVRSVDAIEKGLRALAHKIPVVGEPGTVALMTTPDATDAFEQFAPAGYVNEACARIAIRGDKYRPVKHAADIRCPTLLQICEQDELVPIGSIEKTAEILSDLAEVNRYPIGHFDIYFGEHFETSVADQIAFLDQHL